MSATKTCFTHCDTTGEHSTTDDPAETMFIGPSTTVEPLEIGVVADEEGTPVIHAMAARPKFLKGRWNQ